MNKILMVFGHPNPENSFVNSIITDELSKTEGVSVRCLSSAAGCFDVEAEQNALAEADIIIFQFPLQWFNMPWIFKKWLSDVFTDGFALGEGGNRLKGKILIASATMGGGVDDASSKPVFNLLNDIKEFAEYTGMVYAEPVVSGSYLFVPYLAGDKEDIRRRALEHAEELKRRIASFI
ncbi:flavodoxin family protein [Geovibrio thiophilus]|uniref:Flavodoxin family protein n=1 Tax=Geovibrio thiophilus TaxID=139438 RepID=A0A3R5XWC6_9BACT|nr:NAD(P)H-dependent oxidoreductase [Geovibrio thiophilus]QAR32729.1 flavodoxin family protein [Geovibrio thiophilus]